MSDRIAVMSHGEALQVGGPAEIYERPTIKFVADFIGGTNFLDGTLAAAPNGLARVRLAEDLHVEADAAALAAGSLAPGQPVTVAVRPEKLHLHLGDGHVGDGHGADAPAGPALNTLPGEVIEVVYIGTDTHYNVRLPGGQKLRVREQNTDPASRPVAQPGQPVTVSFVPLAARLLVD
jgi:spermidine/putrescine transport system ATP-binding protein